MGERLPTLLCVGEVDGCMEPDRVAPTRLSSLDLLGLWMKE
jgi:hypothetical protein